MRKTLAVTVLASVRPCSDARLGVRVRSCDVGLGNSIVAIGGGAASGGLQDARVDGAEGTCAENDDEAGGGQDQGIQPRLEGRWPVLQLAERTSQKRPASAGLFVGPEHRYSTGTDTVRLGTRIGSG